MRSSTQTRSAIVDRFALATGTALLLVGLVAADSRAANLHPPLPAATAVQSQPSSSTIVRVDGRVTSPDGIGLPGATVIGVGDAQVQTVSTTTDADGRFELEVSVLRGELNITIMLSGFAKAVVTRFNVRERVTIDVTMSPAFEDHISVGAAIPMLTAADRVGELTLAPSHTAVLPSLGARDLFRAFQLLPGVSGSNETSSGLFVRGGTPDQNAIWLDGFRVYHVDHLFGYFSAFNMDAIESVTLNKGGFEARHGGAVSGVMG